MKKRGNWDVAWREVSHAVGICFSLQRMDSHVCVCVKLPGVSPVHRTLAALARYRKLSMACLCCAFCLLLWYFAYLVPQAKAALPCLQLPECSSCMVFTHHVPSDAALAYAHLRRPDLLILTTELTSLSFPSLSGRNDHTHGFLFHSASTFHCLLCSLYKGGSNSFSL